MNLLVIFAKNPKTNKVKTRLEKDIGQAKATEVYEKILSNLIESNKHQKYKTIIYVLGGTKYFEKYNVETKEQKGDNLGEEMYNCFEEELKFYDNVVIIGSDTPELCCTTINDAFTQLNDKDVVLGPAKDGGYYLVGMGKIQNIFGLKEWSHSKVLKETIDIIDKNNISFDLLEEMRDIDTVEDYKYYKNDLNL